MCIKDWGQTFGTTDSVINTSGAYGKTDMQKENQLEVESKKLFEDIMTDFNLDKKRPIWFQVSNDATCHM